MKKRITAILSAIFLTQTLFFGMASAAYVPENDTYITIETNGQRENFPLSKDTAELMFLKQEELHSKITEITGREIDHSYIWIVIDDEIVLAIDPPSWVP